VLANKGENLARCDENYVHQHYGNQRHCHSSSGCMKLIVGTVLGRATELLRLVQSVDEPDVAESQHH